LRALRRCDSGGAQPIDSLGDRLSVALDEIVSVGDDGEHSLTA
jgi:hypothetical protein